jgi:hypothetical protein
MGLDISTFSGSAYNEKNQHLFTEEYVIEKEGNKILSVKTRFLSPEGSLLAEMSSDFPEHIYVPQVRFAQTNHVFNYGTTVLEKSIQLFKSSASQLIKRKTVPLKHNMVAGHGFYFYILDQLNILLAGKPLQMIFVQPNRLSTYTFNVTALQESPELVNVKLTMDNSILKALTPEIHLTINPITKTLLSYKGLSGFFADDHSLKKIHVNYTTPKTLPVN